MIPFLKLPVLALGSVMLLSACDSDDFVEQEKTDYLCSTVDNYKIDGTSGTRNTVIAPSGNTTTVGYMNNGELVPHSECSAAIVEETGTQTIFSWYEFGKVVASDDNDGAVFISFTTDNTKMIIDAKRIANTGTPTYQTVERPIDGNDTDNARTTRLQWDDEILVDSIVAQDYYDDDAFKNVIAVNGKISKEIRFDENASQWNCIYVNDGFITTDTGCVNESSNDIKILGYNLGLQSYFNQLSAPISFEVDESELMDDVERYYDIL